MKAGDIPNIAVLNILQELRLLWSGFGSFNNQRAFVRVSWLEREESEGELMFDPENILYCYKNMNLNLWLI